jgi:hypothetical protein
MKSLVCTAIFAAALFVSVTATAAETDQYFERAEPIADSTTELNRKLNAQISRVVKRNRLVRDQDLIVHRVFDRLGGYRMTDKYEDWVINSPLVETREVSNADSIYAGMPVWSIRAVAFFGLAETLRVDDQLIGSDKLSHFLSQGRKFYGRYRASGSEKKAAKRGVLTEKAIFGSGMTGSFSNADLVANYEGYLFYRSLFEDDVIAGKSAILKWTDGGWVVQREFDWADHVNAYWDEALNVNAFDALLRGRMADRLADLCPQYWKNPELFKIRNEAALRDRYAHLGMRDTRDMRLNNVCRGDMGDGYNSAFASF